MEVAVLSTGTLLEQLGFFLARPYLSIRAVRKSEIGRLRNELVLLNRSIEEADRSIEREDSVRIYAGQLREVANLIEDVLDEYDLLSANDSGYMRRAGVLLGKLRSRENLKREIENVKSLLVNIRNRGEAYGTREELDEVLIGDVEQLTSDLLLGGDLKLSAVAVRGMGGLGKTTLAKRMYCSKAATVQFDIRAWIGLPYDFNGPGEILRLTAMELQRGWLDDQVMSIEEMVKTVRESLSGKRYLLVFDDVWNEDFLRIVRDFLPDDGVGSRVVVTSRSRVIAASSDRTYQMALFSMEESWELFCRTAFGGDCPEELREASLKIVELCQGLPLTIKAVAGLLSTKPKDPHEWRKVLKNFSLDDDLGLMALSWIIAFGFDELPLHLRKCFMYFSIFPEGSVIRKEKLFRLWIAEGFIQEVSGKTLEEVAEGYLEELIRRHMVKSCDGIYGTQKFCRVHELIHEMVRKKATNRDFCIASEGKDSSLRVKCRRVIISSAEGLPKALNAVKESQVRSVFLWDTGSLDKSSLVRLFKKYYLLTMLDIENSVLEVLPKEVGYLSCLKYLSLKNTRVRKLPETLRMLSRLEMCDLRGSFLVELPTEITKLACLRHLLASHGNLDTDSEKGVKIKEGIGGLAHLQTLGTVDANLSGIDVMLQLGKLNQLRSLRVSRLTTGLAYTLCACINEMIHLKSLHLHAIEYETLDLQTVSSPPTQLELLVLKGELLSLPDWIPRLNNLRTMRLSLSSLADDPLDLLRHLPNLESLWLYGAYRGPRLAFGEGFVKLKVLALREMRGLKEIEIVEASMPLLEELRIGPSPDLAEVPAGVARLMCLKVVSFYDMPDDFMLRLQPSDGSEFHKFQHVPSVLFWYRLGAGRGYVSYRLGDPKLLRHSDDWDTNSGRLHRQDSSLSFSYSEDEGDNICRSSFTSSFFSDDIED